MAFFCKGRREKFVSPFDELAKYESAKLAEHKKKFKRLYKPTGLRGYDTLVVPLSEGDDRADAILRVLMRAYVDPDSRDRRPFVVAEWLETLDLIGIYGKRIAVLHDTLCGGDVLKTTACLKAWSYNWISSEQMLQAVADPDKASFVAEEVLQRIQKVIPGFAVQ